MAADCLYFVGVLLGKGYPIESVTKVLTHYFGPLVLPSESYQFVATSYYEPEMGSSLTRHFYAFESLQSPAMLAEIKHETIEIEKKHFTKNGNRVVNLDPGYIDEVKIVLASTKPGGHKIALSQDIYENHHETDNRLVYINEEMKEKFNNNNKLKI